MMRSFDFGLQSGLFRAARLLIASKRHKSDNLHRLNALDMIDVFGPYGNREAAVRIDRKPGLRRGSQDVKVARKIRCLPGLLSRPGWTTS
jgi:hypothetical protein